MNVAIYARFSSSSQREASIEEQIKSCTDLAKRNGHTIVHVYKDCAMTGKNDMRPALQRLLADSAKKLFDIVAVYSIDRLGRNLKQLLNNIDRLEKDNGILLLSVTEQFDNSPSGRFFRNIMMSYAQFYSDELAVKIRRGMDYNAEKCLSTGGNIALGYKTVGKDKHFEIDPMTAPVVRMIFEMYSDGKTVTEITQHLNLLGIKTSRGVPFNKNSLHTILKNKRYIGIYTYKGTETPDGIPRIITDELFEKVAGIMNKNKKAPARAKAKIEYLLTTKLFCGHCREMMTGFSSKGHLGTTYRYYICNGKKDKRCKKKMISKEYIEELILAECRKVLSPSNINKIAKEVVAVCEAEQDTSYLQHLKRCLSENERKQKNVRNAIAEADEPEVRADLYKDISQLKKDREELEKQMAQESVVLPTLTEPKIKFFLTSLKKGKVNDMKYRKTLINIFVNKIFLYDDRVTITFNSGDAPVTIDDILLSKISEGTSCPEGLFLKGGGPPKVRQTNQGADHICGWQPIRAGVSADLCSGEMKKDRRLGNPKATVFFQPSDHGDRSFTSMASVKCSHSRVGP